MPILLSLPASPLLFPALAIAALLVIAAALLTANEAEFFRRLQRALPAFHVFPQVSFAALLTDDGQLSRKAQWAVRARFDRKIADFVICDRQTLKVVALVELDDRMHNARADSPARCNSARARFARRPVRQMCFHEFDHRDGTRALGPASSDLA